MDPSVQELEAMNDIGGVYKWIGVRDGLKTAIEEVMGQLQHFREVVLCPEDVWTRSIQELRVITLAAQPEALAVGTFGQQGHVPARPPRQRGDRPLNVLEASQVGSLRRICRLRLNFPAEESPSGSGGGPQQAQQGPPAPEGLVVKSAAASLISEVIDQADHTEVAPWRPERVRTAMGVYRVGNKGEEAPEGCEPTPLMFAALEYKLMVVGSPYADFSVWRQNGGRLQKKMKLTIHHKTPKGEWVPYEIAGPSDVGEWKKGWKVFCVAMRAMDMADQPRLDAYEAVIEALVDVWGDQCWWIIAQGDGRMRSERMVRHLTMEMASHEAAQKEGKPHAFEPRRPWNWIFKVASVDKDFWQAEVKDKCLRWTTRTQSAEAIKDDGFGVVKPANTGLDLGQQGGGGGGGGGAGGKWKRKKHESSSSGDEEPKWRMKGMKKKKGGGKGALPKKMVAPNPTFVKPKVDKTPPWQKATGGGGKGKGGKGKTPGGKQVCFKYAREEGCSEPCPDGRAHVCEHCYKQHTNSQCTG